MRMRLFKKENVCLALGLLGLLGTLMVGFGWWGYAKQSSAWTIS